MKSKCGKIKIKGWKAEHRIDKVLNGSFLYGVFGWHRKRNSKQVITALKQAKTCIQSLHSRIKFLNKMLDEKIKDKGVLFAKAYYLDKKIKEQSSLINQLQFDNDSLSVVVEELREKNDKLKDELDDCIMSNQLLERENNRLRDVLSDISFRTPALGETKSDMKRALLDIDNICRAILNGDDE